MASTKQRSYVSLSRRIVWQRGQQGLKRWLILWHILFFVVLFSITGAYIWQNSLTQNTVLLTLVTACATGGWYCIALVQGPGALRRRPLLTTSYLALGWVFWFLLISFSPSYAYMLLVLYPQINICLSGYWKFSVLFIVTILVLWRILFWDQNAITLALVIFCLAFCALVSGIYIDHVIKLNAEKDRLLYDLEVTRNELAEASRRAGIVEERQRLAHEIHDTLAQGFNSITMYVGTIESILPKDKDKAQRYLQQIRQIARTNLEDARRLMWALRPEALEHTLLPDVLKQFTHEWSTNNHITTHFVITGTQYTLRPEVEVTLFRAVQEGLTNVLKHAKASQVTLTLSYIDDVITLDIQDNGVGFDPLELAPYNDGPNGFGLHAMHERVEKSGGHVSIESSSGEGTTLSLNLPGASILPSQETAMMIDEKEQ